jgi:hypothetical protein
MARHPVKDIIIENPPIEEIVARFYGSAEPGKAAPPGEEVSR